jgi:hypothetical protein
MQIHEIFLGHRNLLEALQPMVAPEVQKAFQRNPRISGHQLGQQIASFANGKNIPKTFYSQWAAVDRQISDSLAGNPAKLENYKTRTDPTYLRELTKFVNGNLLDGIPEMQVLNRDEILQTINQISQPDNTDRYESVQTLFQTLTDLCIEAQTNYILKQLQAQAAQQQAAAVAAEQEAQRQRNFATTVAIRNKQRAQAAGIQQGA